MAEQQLTTPGVYAMPAQCRYCGAPFTEYIFIGHDGLMAPSRAMDDTEPIGEPICTTCVDRINTTAERLLTVLEAPVKTPSR